VESNDIAELKRMRNRGEISDEEYETLRRHVLWGVPLPDVGQHYEPDPPVEPMPPPATHAWTPPPPPPPPGTPPAHLPSPGYHTGAQPAVPPDTGWATGAPGATGAPRGIRSYRHTETGPPQSPTPTAAPAPPRLTAPSRPPAEPAGGRFSVRGRTAFLGSLLLVVVLISVGVWWFVIRREGVSPADYARSVCSRVQGWHDDVSAKSGELQRALNTNDDREATRESLARFFDQVAVRTDQLHRDVAEVGTPGVAAGGSYQHSLDVTLANTATRLRDAANRSHALPTTDRTAFAVAVQNLQAQVDQVISGVTDALASTSTPAELRTAYSNTADCAPFTG